MSRLGRGPLVVLGAAALLVATGCTSSSRPSPTPSTSTPAPTGTGSGEVKQPIQGLIDRQGEPPRDVLAVVHAYVVKVNWSDLQPTAFGPITPNNAIDQAIARVRQPDFKAVGMALKLRVFAGINAPAWAKALGGPPVTYVNNQQGGSVAGGTIGRFWTSDFGHAYADLQEKLAAKYDDVPELREITVSRCSTIFDELFVRQPGDVNNRGGLLSAGYTRAADEQCIKDAISAHTVWKHTISDVDFNPFPNVQDPNQPADLAFTEQMMQLCRQKLGPRCGLQNNSISDEKLANPTFVAMYAAMTRLGPPIVLQTAARKRLGDEERVLQAAVKVGANSVELPQGYPSWPESLLTATEQALDRNPLTPR
jgi:hypothetical protein